MGILRIMSHNVWKCDDNQLAWEEKGLDCSAPVRSKGMVRVYTETHPDIIGFQEMSYVMSEKIIGGLLNQGYRYALLWGKDTPILYRQDRLELLDSDFLLYPMEIPGYDGQFNNQDTKSWCIGVFRDKTDGKKLIFMSTHLWWKSGDSSSVNYQEGSEEARDYQLNMAMDRLEKFQAEYECPIVITGDFNADYTKPVIKNAMLRGYEHAHNIATEFKDDDWGYHYCFADGYKPYVNKPFEKAIDHILVKFAPENFVRRFERYTPEYYLPLSDHSPVFADIEL
ncbi:MAG: endonuclease/exonuclease/phosphatase family protein [Clostridia bacterium]|nr:endonuclease/exonuclease/phosphatase family protein [Clostridia bacterium]